MELREKIVGKRIYLQKPDVSFEFAKKCLQLLMQIEILLHRG